MTTVVASRKYVVADSQSTRGNLRGSTPKLFRGPGGSVFGISGCVSMALSVIDFLCGQGDEPEDWSTSDAEVLWLRSDGIWLVEENLQLLPANANCYAIGSGAQIAFGALYMGASLEQAVKAATKYDVYTGGRIQKMELLRDHTDEDND